MNQIKQVQQLKEDGILIKEVVRRTGISRKTVRKYLRKIESISLAESTSAVVSDKQLASVVYNSDITVIRSKRFEALIAHFKQAMEELHNTGVKPVTSGWTKVPSTTISTSSPPFKRKFWCRHFFEPFLWITKNRRRRGRILLHYLRRNRHLLSVQGEVYILAFKSLKECGQRCAARDLTNEFLWCDLTLVDDGDIIPAGKLPHSGL